MQTFFTNQLPDRTVVLQNGLEYLWFSGTDYLGMGNNETFRSYLKDAFNQYGTHFGSSRSNSLRLHIFPETESNLAIFVQAPDALTVSSGMWAGQLVMKETENLAASQSIFYHYAPGVHPAIWGRDYSIQTGSWNEWAKKTVEKITASSVHSSHIICTDSVGSPRVEEFNLSLFKDLPAGRNIWLIADDSHGIGVTGENGNGVYHRASTLKNVNLIVTASLNKGMGIPGGLILAERGVIDKLKLSPWFSGASPLAPAYCLALLQLLKNNIYHKEFEKLKTNIRYFKILTSGLNLFESIEDYPVLCSTDPALFQFLLDNRIMASCFPYPLSTNSPVTRLAINARHNKEDLDRLAEVCIKFTNH